MVIEGGILLVFLSCLHFASITFFPECKVKIMAVVADPVTFTLERRYSVFIDDILYGGVVCVHLNSNNFKFIT